MNRDEMLSTMAERSYDLLVVGGGITGAGVAREASLRGFRVALVEQADFAFGTSSRSTKLIHGGLRYLKQFDFKLVREAVEERQALLVMAPHLVKATPFVFPVYRGDPDSLLALRLGLFIYDLFARMKAPVPHRILPSTRLLQVEPELRRQGLVGGGIYTDSRTDDGRLTLEVLQSAMAHGAVAANYARLQDFIRDARGQVAGARVRDTLNDVDLEIRADRTLAAAGPWADEIRRLEDPSAASVLRLTKGVHITVPRSRLPLRNAVVMRGRDKRVMFAIPSGDFSYLGTTDTDYHGRPGEEQADLVDVDYILDATNYSFPPAALTQRDVVSTWVGVRPLVSSSERASPSEISRGYALFRGPAGLVSVGGGKLTAFRAMASHIVDELFPASRSRAHVSASSAPLPGAAGPLPGPGDWSQLAEQTGVSPERAQQLGSPYGTALKHLAQHLPPSPGEDPELDWYRAMTRHAVRSEMARRLEDVYRRRTGLMLFTGDNGRRYLQPLAEEMASLLDWSPDRTRDEIEHTESMIDRMFLWRRESSASASVSEA